jgi:hypothetical protein
MKSKEDLQIKVGTVDEAYWTNALEQAEQLVNKGKNDLQINKMIVKLAKRKIAVEQKKLAKK